MKMNFDLKSQMHGFGRWILISALVGVGAGLLSAFFLTALNFVTQARESKPELIWFLPFAGLAVGFLYHRYGRSVDGGNNLILDEIHEPRSTVPFRMVPLILVGTLITHLFGGSAGREGTAVQMGASLADQLTKRFKFTPDERTTLLMAGMSAGFGSIFGVPWAGALFGLEVLSIGGLRFRRGIECLIASMVGHFTVVFCGVHHTHYVSPLLPQITPQVLGCVLFAGLAFGVCSQAFAGLIHLTQTLFRKTIAYAPLRPFIGGLLVVAGYWWLGTNRYAGLGIPIIEDSLKTVLPRVDFAYKSLFTILTLGSGFKGGEVTPLLFIGATFGNSLGYILPVNFSLLAALGFVGVFAGAANTPLTCTVMAMEIFGPEIGLLALVACYASYLLSGHHGIYRSQRIQRYKPGLRSKIRSS